MECVKLSGQHITDISSNAAKTLGFICRNLLFAHTNTKEVVYKPLVRPILQYQFGPLALKLT